MTPTRTGSIVKKKRRDGCLVNADYFTGCLSSSFSCLSRGQKKKRRQQRLNLPEANNRSAFYRKMEVRMPEESLARPASPTRSITTRLARPLRLNYSRRRTRRHTITDAFRSLGDTDGGEEE